MFETAQFILSVTLLSFTTKFARKAMFESFFLIFNSNSFGHFFYSLLYLPGTLIHELSHFFTAALLGVRTGNISIFPKREENRLKLGSVEIEKTDFLRSSLIGIAPFIIGSIALLYLTSVLGFSSGIDTINNFIKFLIDSLNPTTAIKLYLLIAISNTLFTSKEDRRHWPVFIIISLIVYIAIIVSGRNIAISSNIQSQAKSILLQITGSFYLAIFLNLAIFIIFSGIKLVLSKITKKKIVYKK